MPNVLHYRGNVVAALMAQKAEGKAMGPDLAGAHYEILEADYDAEQDRTTARLRPFAAGDDGRRLRFVGGTAEGA